MHKDEDFTVLLEEPEMIIEMNQKLNEVNLEDERCKTKGNCDNKSVRNSSIQRDMASLELKQEFSS